LSILIKTLITDLHSFGGLANVTEDNE